MKLRLPNITATDPAGQVAQMRSYLYYLAQELQFNIDALEKKISAEQDNGKEG